MGIRNRDGALYMVTGIDNSGLYEGKREAMGIIKTLAGEITSFDVFGGIGISAATAFAKAAKSSYDFEKEFRKNMLEVATISTQVTDDMTGFMNQVMSITQEIPIKAPEAAKALYSIVSAGHDGADGMKILEVSAKAAVGGLTETETAADAITTILNAYKMSAEEAGTVSDQLFTTVRLGKTTFGELGASIAQVAPIAAAYGISIDQVLGAVASLTKQGTPTAQAMTQIRAAIQGTAGELGDAAFQGRTFQEALQLIYEKAGGSASKMKEMLGTDEGLAATLALTGKNAKAAASDLEELQSSLGATEAAFEKMKDEVGNQMTLLSNNIQAALRPMGEMILKEVSGIAKSFNEAFESGDLERSLTTLKSLLEVSAAAWGAYKVSVIAAMVAENLRYQSSLAHMQGMTKMQALLAVLKGKTDALTASLLKNPYALMAAAVAALGVALYKLWTYQTNAQKQQEKLNKTFSEFTVEAAKEERSLNSLFEALKRTNSGTEERKKMIKAVNDQYGQYLPKLLTEKSSLEEINEAYSIINTSIKEQIALKIKNSATDEIVTSGLKEQVSAVSEIRKSLTSRVKNVGLVDSIVDEIKQTTDEFQKAGSTWEKAWQQAYFNIQRKYTGKVKLGNDFASSMEDYVKSVFNTEQTVSMIEKQYAPFISRIKGLNENVEEAVSTTETKTVVSEDEKALKLRKKLQQKIQDELLALRRQNQQSEIDLMKEGSEKKIAQINLDYDNEIAAILAKEKEWKDAQGGKLTKEQTVEIRTALVNSYVKRERSTSNVSKEQLEEEKRAMNEYLKEYGSYLDKRDAITALYNEKIAKATTEGEKLSLGEEMKKELAAVDDEAQKKTSIITKLFSDMSKRTVVDIRSISKEAQAMLDYINEGEFKTGSDGKGLFGLTKEQFDILSKSPEKLQAIKDEIANVNKEADQMDTSFNKVSNGLKKVFSAGDDTKRLKEGLAEIDAGMSDIMQAGQFLSDTFSKLGDAFGSDLMSGIAEGLNVAMDAVNSAMDGAKAGSMFGPIGASAGAAIGVVTSLASSIAKIHDKKIESRIQRLQDQIDTLDKSYDKLGRSIEKAYSKDASKLIDQQNKLLEQQKVLIQNQIKEEEDKKKTDNDRIKEWRDQIDEINNTIADNKEVGKDAIFGSDIKSAIDDFANAYADAWAAGEDKAQSAKDLVRKMIRNMVTESIKAAASDPMKEIREKLLEFWSDDYISDWEQDYLDRKAQELADDLDRKFGWADKYFNTGNAVEEDDGRTASSKGVGSISQDSADVIDGKMSTQLIFLDRTLVQVTGIADQMRLIHDLQTRGWKNVEAIKDLSGKVSENTAKVAEISGRIEALSEKIEANTKSAASGIKTINDKGILMRSR
ncbi:phage tail tape measure protein [Parabacteroides distasonis]|jgi:TP901 family phage tail tape measure protein|uniref:Phage tail tape measure protein n=1 Tax=Parabacteroides distasonis TaxID=823 RepID=A0A3R6ESF4_PARDI|nr:phage tail tape measure protein [Parabacteroides distasonis]MBM6518772.1 phage tail tape measure protein [Parabacteroides distasonis]RGM58375.1 phage tail tape measure protein [Parabacteroides distasonis]RGR34585.1 phage tail tape measure protein [Parabacteroides distasonis]RHB88008.1 phage tail tape measure protein [Parabacteroides distasonis]RHD17830.1 phage tail tape measure protein [Parabacteroides distasonis]